MPGTNASTFQVCTFGYCAPEILRELEQYTKAIDVWSLGCILAEVFMGQELFVASKRFKNDDTREFARICV